MKNTEKLTRIASFTVNHDYIVPGMYISRIDGDITTYDLRFRRPNCDSFMDNATMHSIEHLFATYVRNSEIGGRVIYFGPMGCRTGFYFLTRGMTEEQVVSLTRETLAFIAEYTGEIPGASKRECGNYLEHDLEGARRYAAAEVEALAEWTPARLVYPD